MVNKQVALHGSSDSNLSKLSLDELTQLLSLSPGSRELAKKEFGFRVPEDIFDYFKGAALPEQLSIFDIMKADQRFENFMTEAKVLLPIELREPVFSIDD